jgi:hypothetical protein
MLTVVVTLKAWGSNFSGKKIVINCDNLVTVRVINTGASRNKFLQSCLREICFIAAINSFDIKVRHISGKYLTFIQPPQLVKQESREKT